RRIANELLNARFDEFRDIVLAGELVSPAAAARFLREEESHLSFIPSPVELGASLSLTDQELYELYRTNGQVTLDDETELGGRLPSIRELPTPDELQRLLDEHRNES